MSEQKIKNFGLGTLAVGAALLLFLVEVILPIGRLVLLISFIFG